MRLVTDYLDHIVQEYPEKIAFANEQDSMTFSQVHENARKVAVGLIKENIFKQPIVVFMEKSPICITSFLGVAYSGNFYTPIDTQMPSSRIHKIINTLHPAVVITNRMLLSSAEEAFDGYKILLYEDLQQNMADFEAIEAVKCRQLDTDLLYVLFTSGSTGDPKVVTISHQAVIDYTDWVTNAFDLDASTTLGNQAALYFDLSIQDVYAPLKTGATTWLLEQEKFAFPIRLLEYLNEKKINTIFWVPSALVLVANLKALRCVTLPNLQKVLFCGEVMPNKQLNIWRKALPHAAFVNLYGPTEITEVCTYYRVEREFKDEEALPIGRACENMDVFILGEDDCLITGDEIGELCVRGRGLSYGYYNNPEKSAEVFVQNPLQTNYHEMIYRTGDLVRYNEFGELMYAGRKDFQIKHMGHRIELGEIETAALAVEGIKQACCLYDTARSRIVLFYAGAKSDEELKELLPAYIPHYMIPNRFVKMDEIPLNMNGKLDRVWLKSQL